MSTLPDILRRHVANDGARIILRRKDRGIWKPVRWTDLGNQVRALTRALHADGFGAGAVGAVLADTRPEWVFADLALQAAGAISAGLSPTASADEIVGQLRQAGVGVLFVENEEQLDKVLAARSSCPSLRRIVLFEMKGLRDLSDPMCLSLPAFLALGASVSDDWDTTIDALVPDAPAALIYAEDSAGQTHSVRLSHRNLLAATEAAARLFGLRVGDERLAVMPMAHVSERVLGLYLSLQTGCISNYGESADTLEENLREVKPTVLLAAPWLWKRFRDRIVLAAGATTWTQRMLLHVAFAAGGSTLSRDGHRSAPWAAGTSLLARPVLASVRRALGLSRLRLGLIAGGTVDADIVRWFMILGIDPIQVYGPPEAAGLGAASQPAAVRPGDCGSPIAPDMLCLSADGEIEISNILAGCSERAPVDPGTAGWLQTGDAGMMTDGRLTVLGPGADTITLLDGTSVHPGPIERALCVSPYIANALVIGQGQQFLSCLLRLDIDAVENWAHSKRVPFTSFTELVGSERLRALLTAEIARVNSGVAQTSPVRAFRAIDRPLQHGDPELTLLGALRRRTALAAFEHLVAAMYREGTSQAPALAQHATELTDTGAR